MVCTYLNNFSLKIRRRFLTVRKQKFKNIAVFEANNLVMKMKLDKWLEPYGTVSCSCTLLKPAVEEIHFALEFLYSDYCHIRCLYPVGVHACMLISEGVKPTVLPIIIENVCSYYRSSIPCSSLAPI